MKVISPKKDSSKKYIYCCISIWVYLFRFILKYVTKTYMKLSKSAWHSYTNSNSSATLLCVLGQLYGKEVGQVWQLIRLNHTHTLLSRVSFLGCAILFKPSESMFIWFDFTLGFLMKAWQGAISKGRSNCYFHTKIKFYEKKQLQNERV